MINDSLMEYYQDIALEAVFDFAAAQNVIIRRSDFWLFESEAERRAQYEQWKREAAYNYSGDKSKPGHTKRDYEQISNHVEGKYWEKGGKVNGIVSVILYYGSTSNDLEFVYGNKKCESRLKGKVDRFLNYRFAIDYPRNKKLVFSFTLKDLDIIAADKDNKCKDGVAAEKAVKEKVLDKINKLLLKTEQNGASEKEAIAASTKVQELLAKYHLTLADVKGEDYREGIETVSAVVKAGKKWRLRLADIVADGYCCKCFYTGTDTVSFYGYETDILSARRVFLYLFGVGDKLANQYVKRKRENYGTADGSYNSFVEGFMSGIQSEFEKQCTALALIVQPEVITAYDELTKNFKTLNTGLNFGRYNTIDFIAYEDGYVEGKRALRGQYIEDGKG